MNDDCTDTTTIHITDQRTHILVNTLPGEYWHCQVYGLSIILKQVVNGIYNELY